MTYLAERAVALYCQRGTTEQSVKEDKNADTWTRLPRHRLVANAVWPQRRRLTHAVADEVGDIRHCAESARINPVCGDVKSILKRDEELGKVEAVDTQIVLYGCRRRDLLGLEA
jgi:hypothetical protein